MGIENWFRRRSAELSEAHREANRLFDIGKAHAIRFQTDKALEYFDQSYALFEHPAPLMNRAHIKMMRIRHFEAMQDLQLAQKLDAKLFGNEFKKEMAPALAKLKITTGFYQDGTREQLISDLRQNGRGYVAKRILFTCFKVDPDQWEFAARASPLMKFHFFNELDNIARFESPGSYPDIDSYRETYPKSVASEQLNRCPSESDYLAAETMLHSFLCSYEQRDMANIRSDMLYLIHDALMTESHGLVGFGR